MTTAQGSWGSGGSWTRCRARLAVVFTPGVIHLPSVPVHRKANRIDLGTADKGCSAALAIDEQAARRRCPAGARRGDAAARRVRHRPRPPLRRGGRAHPRGGGATSERVLI